MGGGEGSRGSSHGVFLCFLKDLFYPCSLTLQPLCCSLLRGQMGTIRVSNTWECTSVCSLGGEGSTAAAQKAWAGNGSSCRFMTSLTPNKLELTAKENFLKTVCPGARRPGWVLDGSVARLVLCLPVWTVHTGELKDASLALPQSLCSQGEHSHSGQ